jgi:hypothetical protein
MQAPADIGAAMAFLRPAFAKITANLELLIGKPVTMTTGEPVTLGRDQLPSRIPSPGMVLGFQATGVVEAPLRCVVSQQLVLALIGAVQLKNDEALLERLAAATPLSDAEKSSATEIASFIVAALGDLATEATGGKVVLAPMDPRFLDAADTNELGSGDSCIVVDSALAIAPAQPAPLVLIVPPAIVAAWSAPAVEAVPAFGAAPGRATSVALEPAPSRTEAKPAAPNLPAVWATGREPFLASVAAAAGGGLAVVAHRGLAELLAAVYRETPPALVLVEVAQGSEFQLDLLAAMRRHPALRKSTVVIALEAPTRSVVLKCAGLGLVDVIPANLDRGALSQRLLARSRANARDQ